RRRPREPRGAGLWQRRLRGDRPERDDPPGGHTLRHRRVRGRAAGDDHYDHVDDDVHHHDDDVDQHHHDPRYDDVDDHDVHDARHIQYDDLDHDLQHIDDIDDCDHLDLDHDDPCRDDDHHAPRWRLWQRARRGDVRLD